MSNSFHGEEPLRLLIDIASRQHLAELFYRKGVTRSQLHPRVVEPYSFTQGKQDAMVRCYQLTPEEGWRFFMIHKLDQVSDLMRPFIPRVKITLPQVKVDRRYRKDPSWTPALKAYRNLIGDALSDGCLSAKEMKDLEDFKAANNISVKELRFVHASIFHRCLGAVLDDGVVDEEECRQIRFLHKVLSALGWTVGQT